MNRCAVIATHHKTGTVWMRDVFRGIAGDLMIPFHYLSKRSSLKRSRLAPPAVCLNDHADFSAMPWLLEEPDHRILHVVRDPRDVLISAMHYHRVAHESWLHVPRKTFEGMSYQQKLNSLPDDNSRYILELKHSTGRTIKKMCSWNYGANNCFECRYEDLAADFEMKLFTEILLHLGFAHDELEICRANFWKNSLFGDRSVNESPHVRKGAPRQWIEVFDRELAALFWDQFGSALTTLGYEQDDSWTRHLKVRSTDA
jgi:hypothetical protein